MLTDGLACLSADIAAITSELSPVYPGLRLSDRLIRSLIFSVRDVVTYSMKKSVLMKKINSEITRIDESDRNGLRIVFLRAYLRSRTMSYGLCFMVGKDYTDFPVFARETEKNYRDQHAGLYSFF